MNFIACSVIRTRGDQVNTDNENRGQQASGLEASIHRAAIDWLNRHPGSRGLRNYFCIRLAALTFPVPGERVTIRQIARIARPRLRRDEIQIDIHLYASDLHASARFYTVMGFDLSYDKDPFGSPPCYVGHLGPTRILVYAATPKMLVTRGLRVGLRLDDPEATMQRLANADIPFERPAPRNFALASDPDGNRITLAKRGRR